MSNVIVVGDGAGIVGDISYITAQAPTSTAKYKLGTIVLTEDSSKTTRSKWMYVKAHAALTQYQPYIVAMSGFAGAEFVTAAPLTLAAPGYYVCVPQVAFTTLYFGWVLIGGDGKGLATAETYAVGDMIQVITAGTAFNISGSSGGTQAFAVETCGMYKEAGSTAVARAIWLMGERAVITSS